MKLRKPKRSEFERGHDGREFFRETQPLRELMQLAFDKGASMNELSGQALNLVLDAKAKP